MSTNTTTVICIPFHTEVDDGCDYTAQTITMLEKKHRVFVLMFSQPRSWRDLYSLVRGKKKLVESDANTIRVHPFLLIPFQRIRLIKQINFFFTAWLTKTYISLRYSSARRIFWFFEPQHVLGLLLIFRSFESVYDMVDDFATQEQDAHKRDKISAVTDLITVNSQTLFDRYRNIHPKIVRVPLGFSLDLFAQTAKKLPRISPISRSAVVGFVGGVNYRFDFSLLFALVERLPELEFRFVGPLQLGLIDGDRQTAHQVKRLFEYPNVTYIENQPKAKIPRMIEQFDICMIPYDVHHPFNRYSFPMKVMEYLYLGKPIITTPILEFLPLRKHVSIVHDANDAVREIRKYITKGWSAEHRKAQRQVTKEHTWEAKVSASCAALGIAR